MHLTTYYKQMKIIQTAFTLACIAIFSNLSQAQSMAKKFQTVQVEIHINAPAQEVWQALVLDYGAISNFSPYIYSSSYQNGSLKGVVGAQRKCFFSEDGSQWVHERIAEIDHKNMVMRNVPIGGQKLPLNFDNSQAYYRVKDHGDGTCTASYEFQYRTKPGIMTAIVKGNFKKQLAGTLIGLKHYVETGEKVTPMNDRYSLIKKQYMDFIVVKK